MNEREKLLANEPVGRLLFKYAIPSIIAMIVNAIYNIVDRIYISRIPDASEEAMSGIGVSFPLVTFLFAFALLIGIGGSVNISISLGKRDRDMAEKVLGNAFVFAIVISLILTAVCIIFLDNLLWLFGAREASMPFARDYSSVLVLGCVFNTVGISLNHQIRGAGNPYQASSTMLIGAVLNCVLDPVFIFVFDMGIRGAAIATVISQAVSLVWVLRYYFSDKATVKIKKKNLKLDPNIIKMIIAIGMSSFVMQIATAAVGTVANNSLLTYGGEYAIGAMTAISSVSTLFILSIIGLNQGVQPIVGYNFGAENYGRVKGVMKCGVFAGTCISFAGWLVIMIFPSQIAGMFSKDATAVLAAYGLRRVLFCLPLLGFQIPCATFFQSIGKPKTATFLALLRQTIVLVPLYLILPVFFGLNGIFFAPAISDFTAATITGWIFLRQIKSMNLY